ncbi:MAG: hypothetical protein F6K55_03640 [Moorea sp. SIO4A3]|nr:hypothetical protein [Moorena sp. SIO4A3]
MPLVISCQKPLCSLLRSPCSEVPAPCSEVPAPKSLFQQLILLLSDYLSSKINLVKQTNQPWLPDIYALIGQS